MNLDPIAKTFAVRAPDAPGPDRTGHGVIAYECKVTGIRQLPNGTVRVSLDM